MPARIDLGVRLDGDPPRDTGHAINAALLQAIGAHDPHLATRMHESSPKLYGLSPMLDADNDPHIELGILDDDAIAGTIDAITDLAEISIHDRIARVDTVDVYPAPADAFVMDPDPSRSWQLHFVTPCLLANDAFPTPAVLLRSLAWRGRPFIPGLPDERATQRLAQTMDARYDLALEPHLVKVTNSRDGSRRRALETGFVGRAEIWCHERATQQERSKIGGLLGLASFAGLGRHCAVGMGVVQIIPG